MRILIVTDAWAPQINGVVRTLQNTIRCLKHNGHDVSVISPEQFKTVSCPGYPEIPLSLASKKRFAQLVEAFKPDALHISTEGPLGLRARQYARSRDLRYTTAYHTRFPEYVHRYFKIPLAMTYRYMKWFHRHSAAVMVPTPTVIQELTRWGFKNLVLWSRGVELDLFKPAAAPDKDKHKQIFLYVGRVSTEKNIEAFLNLDLPGEKHVVGDGPQLENLKNEFHDVIFWGSKTKEELPAYYNFADVFVFPSKTDTFGLVMLEAMACGTPVAGLPVASPIDVVEEGATGSLNHDLRVACLDALAIPREKVRESALKWSWEQSSTHFENYLVPARL